MGTRLTFGKAKISPKTMSRKQMIDELWKHGNKGQMRKYFKDADDDTALCGWLEQQSDERLHEIHQAVDPGHVEGGVAKAIMRKAKMNKEKAASKKTIKKDGVALVFGKAKVRQHTRKTKTGKVATVKEHQDSRKDKKDKEVSSHHYVHLDKKQFDDIKTAMEVSSSYGEFARVVAFVTGVNGGVSGIPKADRDTLRDAYKMKDSRFSLLVANDLAKKYKAAQKKDKPEDTFEDVYDCQHLNSKQVERIEDAFESAKDEVDFVRHVVDILDVESLPAKHSADLRDAFNTDDYEQIIAVADRVAGKMKKMRKSVKLTFSKSIVRRHQRTTKDGKVTTVKQYTDKRTKKQEQGKLQHEDRNDMSDVEKKERKARDEREEKEFQDRISDPKGKRDGYAHVERHNFRPGHKVRNPQGHEETVSHVDDVRVVTVESDRRNSWYHPTKVSHVDASLQGENIKRQKAYAQEQREVHQRDQEEQRREAQRKNQRQEKMEKVYGTKNLSSEQIEKMEEIRTRTDIHGPKDFALAVITEVLGDRAKDPGTGILNLSTESLLNIANQYNTADEKGFMQVIDKVYGTLQEKSEGGTKEEEVFPSKYLSKEHVKHIEDVMAEGGDDSYDILESLDTMVKLTTSKMVHSLSRGKQKIHEDKAEGLSESQKKELLEAIDMGTHEDVIILMDKMLGQTEQRIRKNLGANGQAATKDHKDAEDRELVPHYSASGRRTMIRD